MEYGGVALVAAVIVVLAVMVPARIDKQTALTQSREIDRFSPDLRLLAADAVGPCPENCTQASADPETLPTVNVQMGEAMKSINATSTVVTSAEKDMRDQTENLDASVQRRHGDFSRALPGRKATVRQISRLKARRAARLSVERASGQRRMLISAMAACLTVVFALVAAFTPFAWGWVVVPVLALAAALVASRRAAVRSQRLSAAENDELSRLRESLHHPTTLPHKLTMPAQRSPQMLSVPATDQAKDLVTSGVAAPDAQRADAVDDVKVASTKTGRPSEQSDELASVHPSSHQDAVETDQPDGQRSWTVAHIPAPTYATGQRIARRVIHTDTDLRGIPRISAHVPGRPVSVTASDGTESTQEVAERSAVSFNLDDVLDQRRA